MRAPNGATFRNKEQRPQCRLQGRSRKLKRRTWAACWSGAGRRRQRAGGGEGGGGRAAVVVRVRNSTVGVKGP